MRITDIVPEALRSYVQRSKGGRSAGPDASAATSASTAVAPGRVDRVTISPEGRTLAGPDAGRTQPTSPERLAEIRDRVSSGAYESTEAVKLLARMILATRDV